MPKVWFESSWAGNARKDVATARTPQGSQGVVNGHPFTSKGLSIEAPNRVSWYVKNDWS